MHNFISLKICTKPGRRKTICERKTAYLAKELSIPGGPTERRRWRASRTRAMTWWECDTRRSEAGWAKPSLNALVPRRPTRCSIAGLGGEGGQSLRGVEQHRHRVRLFHVHFGFRL